MIAILLAAQLSSMPVPTAAIGESADIVRMHRFQQPRSCSAATRLQTSFATPMLLYRPQDRARTHISKLKDLPLAEACLVGEESREATR